ncbi:MAG: SprT family zinc-dependent metalloprotease [Bacteroidota bacterium]
MEYLTIKSQKIPYVVKRAEKRYRVSIRFAKDSQLLVIESPDGTLSEEVRNFVEAKSSWISRQYQRRKSYHQQRRTFLDNFSLIGEIPYLGIMHKVQFLPSVKTRVEYMPGKLTIYVREKDIKHGEKALLQSALIARAKVEFPELTYKWAKITKSEVKSVRVKNQTTRWGSCSTLKNVNLNWHLIFLPKNLVEYVIVHELMHLREMNHSPAFWNHVATYCPDYKKLDKEVDTYRWVIGILKDR